LKVSPASPATSAYVTGSPSGSVAAGTEALSVVSSGVVCASSCATGGPSLCAVTLTVTVPVACFGSAASLLVPLSTIV
jgi:hypothetical protein